MYQALTVICLFLIVNFGFVNETRGQNISSDTISWRASGFVDVLSNVNVQKACDFITYKDSRIEWLQNNKTIVYSFVISSINGTWTDLNVNGNVTYLVSLDGLVGSLNFKRVGQSLKVLMELHGENDDIKNEYIISAIEQL